jgi:hypothetical protein
MAKPVSPKKETARIVLPSDAPKSSGPALPKATVKMQQTQPLSKSQPPASMPATLITSPAGGAAAVSSSPAKADTATLVLSIVALLGSIAALVFAFLVFKAAELPPWVQQ